MAYSRWSDSNWYVYDDVMGYLACWYAGSKSLGTVDYDFAWSLIKETPKKEQLEKLKLYFYHQAATDEEFDQIAEEEWKELLEYVSMFVEDSFDENGNYKVEGKKREKEV